MLGYITFGDLGGLFYSINVYPPSQNNVSSDATILKIS